MADNDGAASCRGGELLRHVGNCANQVGGVALRLMISYEEDAGMNSGVHLDGQQIWWNSKGRLGAGDAAYSVANLESYLDSSASSIFLSPSKTKHDDGSVCFAPGHLAAVS